MYCSNITPQRERVVTRIIEKLELVLDLEFKQPTFFVIMIAGIAVGFVPIYAWLKYRQFFGGDPRHDLVYQRKYRKDLVKVSPSNSDV